MHLILFELIAHIVEAEIQAKLDEQHRRRLARQATQGHSMPGALSQLTTMLFNAIRQRMAPRGYAMAK